MICSSVIASSFHRVKFPIVPNYEELPPEALPPRAQAQAVADRIKANNRRAPIRRAQDDFADAGDAARFDLSPMSR